MNGLISHPIVPINLLDKIKIFHHENEIIDELNKNHTHDSSIQSQNAINDNKSLIDGSTSNNSSSFVEDNNGDSKGILSVIRKHNFHKKQHNIPICDVKFDLEYEKTVESNFQQPSIYISTIFSRCIDSDNDVVLDYIMEDEDFEWLHTTGQSLQLEDFKVFINQPILFETLINTLEQSTGFAKDPITLNQAERVLSSKMDLTKSFSTVAIPHIYYYWIRKREKNQKPLLRQYWPQTQPNDANPHHVFRARDKERYRLRRQQKRNDMEAFRKMQYLRREFDKASLLLQCVLERENLNQAAFQLQTEIFEQIIHDHQQARNGSYSRRTEKLFRYDFKADDFLHQKELLSGKDSSSIVIGKRENKLDKLARRNALNELKSDADGRDNLPLSNLSQAAIEREKRKRLKNLGAKGPQLHQESVEDPMVAKLVDLSFPHCDLPTACNITDIQKYYDGIISQQIPDVVTPLGRLTQLATSQFATFLDPLATRDEVPTFSDIPSNYIMDLEFRQHESLPLKFRSRARIGRGGRLVIDRIPIYDTPVDSSWKNDEPASYCSYSKTHYMSSRLKYIQPTSLPVQPRFTNQSLHSIPSSSKYSTHRNYTSEATVVNNCIFYPQGSRSIATANALLGYEHNTYGFGSALPNHISLNIPDIQSSCEESNSNNPNNPNNPNGIKSIEFSNMQYCLPPSLPTQRGYLPLSFISREKEIYTIDDLQKSILEIDDPTSVRNVTIKSLDTSGSSQLYSDSQERENNQRYEYKLKI